MLVTIPLKISRILSISLCLFVVSSMYSVSARAEPNEEGKVTLESLMTTLRDHETPITQNDIESVISDTNLAEIRLEANRQELLSEFREELLERLREVLSNEELLERVREGDVSEILDQIFAIP